MKNLIAALIIFAAFSVAYADNKPHGDTVGVVVDKLPQGLVIACYRLDGHSCDEGTYIIVSNWGGKTLYKGDPFLAKFLWETPDTVEVFTNRRPFVIYDAKGAK